MNPLAKAPTGSARPHAQPPFLPIDDHVGMICLPGTQREVWWTGRVAIGLRYERDARTTPHGESARWIQDLLLSKRPRS